MKKIHKKEKGQGNLLLKVLSTIIIIIKTNAIETELYRKYLFICSILVRKYGKCVWVTCGSC